MWREIYRRAMDPESFLDSDGIRALTKLDGLADAPSGADWRSLAGNIGAWSTTRPADYLRIYDEALRTAGIEVFVGALLVQSTPLASSLGCWLQGMSAPGVFEDEVHLRMMALFAGDVGVGLPEASRYDHFKALLRQAGHSRFALEPFELSTLPAIPDEAFRLPALLLAMSRRSDAFGPELAGIDLAFRAMGLAPCWTALRDAPEVLFDSHGLDLRTFVGLMDETAPQSISQWVVERFVARSEKWRQRIERAIAWAGVALREWDEVVIEAARRAVSPRAAMAQLMRAKAREGAVYHHEYRLEGRALAEWFEEAMRNPLPLVDALARSRLVVPGFADRSLLVTTLIGPSGRMFRVFSDDDLAIIRRWINCLPESRLGSPEAVPDAQPALAGAGPGTPAIAYRVDDMARSPAPSNLRDLYFALQGRALAPHMQRLAIDYANRWIARARRSLNRSQRGLPRAWRVGALREWLLDQHDWQGLAFERSDPEDMPSREAVVDATLQLAPLTLIDGSWLQGFSDWRLAASQVGFALFQTYWDELGNGCYQLNHPRIFRDGLREMGIELPPTGTRAFACDPRLLDESFRLPVYWLCLGKLPRRFMPEIVGMNLAMELSGVGGSYRSARRFLQHYGFSTDFVDIHNSIDNVSTGHSAWAVDAIDVYMRQAASVETGAARASWERIRVGYESLAPLPSRGERMLGALGLRPWMRIAPDAGRAPLLLNQHMPVAAPA
ncbi:iron-containing redox enzyme family protein [Paraburkholderia sp. JHI2823]|uniref:iron-containing redox enzyme family protein n=1 Tax=Paraburkholderia sp. JHI2823 TaxID=3112960 RepID=UPI00317CEA40